MSGKRLYGVIDQEEPRGQSASYQGIPCTARHCCTNLNRLTEENEQLKEENDQLKKECKIAVAEMVTDYKKLEKENEQLKDENERLRLELETHKHPLWSTREAEKKVNELSDSLADEIKRNGLLNKELNQLRIENMRLKKKRW